MNEQDLILKQKIEKREKFDTILAYILLVVLLGCIALVIYLKVTEDKNNEGPNEYVPDYITLNDISYSLNSSPLANRYMNDEASFGSNVSGNSLSVTYVKEDINLSLSIPMVGNELMVNIENENKEIITDIYKEIANIICMYYGNQEKHCRNTLNNLNNSIDGIRFDNNGNTVYITTTKSFTVDTNIVYDKVTIVDINDSDYTLNLNDITISNIAVATSDINIIFTGSVEKTTEDDSNISLAIKLYDEENNVLAENKYEFNEENKLEKTGSFEVTFLFNDTLTLSSISGYSIEIIK